MFGWDRSNCFYLEGKCKLLSRMLDSDRVQQPADNLSLLETKVFNIMGLIYRLLASCANEDSPSNDVEHREMLVLAD